MDKCQSNQLNRPMTHEERLALIMKPFFFNHFNKSMAGAGMGIKNYTPRKTSEEAITSTGLNS